MSENDTLCEMVKEVERQLLFVLNELTNNDLTFKSSSGSPAIGWIVGHITGFQHFYLYCILQGKDSPLPELDQFDTGTSSVYSKEPSLKDLLETFNEDAKHLKIILKEKAEEEFNNSVPYPDVVPPPFRDIKLRELLRFYFSHQFMHMGQILEVRRMLGKRVWDM